jgi:chitinase
VVRRESLIAEMKGRREEMKQITVLCAALMLLAYSADGQQTPWVSAYYAGWMQSYCPPSAIDYGAVSHVIHFSIAPSGSGVNSSGNGITTSASAAIIQAAHAAGKKVLITCGGWGDAPAFATSTNSTNRTAFINSLVNFVVSRGYDGLDIDWEPISSASQFKLFIPELRAALNAANPGLLLTIASMGGDGSTIASVQEHFDQINIMTYDMSGAWQGWVVWHNAPVYDGGLKFPGTNKLVPSADGDVKNFIAAGIPANKIGIGADFYGYVWSGVTEPRQTWTSTPTVTDNVPYYQLMSTYAANPVLWDATAQAAYISVATGSGKFISLDNAQTMSAKASYIKTKGIGGMIIWELGGGYRASQPAGQRDELLQAVKKAFFSQPTAVRTVGEVPTEFSLEQNYPNPFNPSTEIGLRIADAGFVRLAVYNLLGQELAVLVNETKQPGRYVVRFDGSGLVAGVYFARLESGGRTMVRKLDLVK